MAIHPLKLAKNNINLLKSPTNLSSDKTTNTAVNLRNSSNRPTVNHRDVYEGARSGSPQGSSGFRGTSRSEAATQEPTSTNVKYADNGYKISSEPIPPKWDDTIYDNDYPYNPNMKATPGDRWNWVEWGVKGQGAKLIMPDAARAYNHYRAGSGKDLVVDIAKGYKEDTAVKNSIDAEIRRTQESVERLRAQSGLDEFSISGELHLNSEYPKTENWQKTLGGFNTWSYGDVTYKDGEYHMTITVNVLDRYNFNKGQNDIASGTPDDVNGRFEALGWAKSFNTKGEMTFEITWKEGEIPSSTPTQVNQGR